ncbi:IS66 family transposase zinc-finger binding domain-containing protein, partial [Limosilactobacillus mucosae]
MAQAQQPKNLEEALQVIQQQNELINQLKVALQLQQHRRFAKKNESLNPDQLSLFEEKQVEAPDNHESSDAAVKKREPSRHPKSKQSNSRKENLDCLPQEDCEYDLDDKTCPDCHQEMKQIGRRLASREAVYVPAHTICRNVYAKTYKCQHCHPNGGDKLVTAKTPSPLFNHSYISSSIL